MKYKFEDINDLDQDGKRVLLMKQDIMKIVQKYLDEWEYEGYKFIHCFTGAILSCVADIASSIKDEKGKISFIEFFINVTKDSFNHMKEKISNDNPDNMQTMQ